MMAHGSGSQPNKERAGAAEIGAIGCERLLPQGNGGRCRGEKRLLRCDHGRQKLSVLQKNLGAEGPRSGAVASRTGVQGDVISRLL